MLVAGILQAIGYRSRVSAKGADRGVEVRHRQAALGAQQLRDFLGGRRQGDRCLYVRRGGFTKDARYEAERSTVAVTAKYPPGTP